MMSCEGHARAKRKINERPSLAPWLRQAGREGGREGTRNGWTNRVLVHTGSLKATVLY